MATLFARLDGTDVGEDLVGEVADLLAELTAGLFHRSLADSVERVGDRLREAGVADDRLAEVLDVATTQVNHLMELAAVDVLVLLCGSAGVEEIGEEPMGTIVDRWWDRVEATDAAFHEDGTAGPAAPGGPDVAAGLAARGFTGDVAAGIDVGVGIRGRALAVQVTAATLLAAATLGVDAELVGLAGAELVPGPTPG